MRVDLREGGCFPVPPVADQGGELSCVAQALATALYCAAARRGLRALPSGAAHPPAAELHAATRDGGAGTSFGAAVLALWRLYGRDLRALDCAVLRLPTGSGAARAARAELAARVPVAAGYRVDARVERFHRSAAFRAALGYVLPPVRAPLSTAGGHCVLLVGFDDAAACFVARNSWGRRWGHEGHCVVRYDDVDSAEMFTDLVALR